jgi:hypothetical protein
MMARQALSNYPMAVRFLIVFSDLISVPIAINYPQIEWGVERI